MTVIRIHIPDDIETALAAIPGDKEQFILEAVRHQLSGLTLATEGDIESAAALDLGDDFLSQDELNYYLNLPNENR